MKQNLFRWEKVLSKILGQKTMLLNLEKNIQLLDCTEEKSSLYLSIISYYLSNVFYILCQVSASVLMIMPFCEIFYLSKELCIYWIFQNPWKENYSACMIFPHLLLYVYLLLVFF